MSSYTDTNNKKSSIDSCPLKCHRACDSTWYNNKISMANFPGELFTSSKMGDYIRIKKGNVSKQQLKEYLKYIYARIIFNNFP